MNWFHLSDNDRTMIKNFFLDEKYKQFIKEFYGEEGEDYAIQISNKSHICQGKHGSKSDN